MATKYAPALLLEVLAFWFVVRWLLSGWLILLFGRLLVLMMAVGVLATLDAHYYVWAAWFASAAFLAWLLLRRWRGLPARGFYPAPGLTALAWRRSSATDVAILCERRLGLPVDAAAPASLAGSHRSRFLLALAGDGLWVLEDESRLCRARVGRVLACWDRASVVPRVEHSHRHERFEFSWPRQHALVRGVMPSGAPADLLAGHLLADQLTPH